MWNNGQWEKPKVVLYCSIGSAIDLAQFSILGPLGAIQNAGLPPEDFDIVFMTWKSSPQVYAWLKENNLKYEDQVYDEGKGFLWNLYKCAWNAGYRVGFQHADYVCAIATDHAFAPNWLANLMKNAKPNRVVNCKLIEPGTCETLHQIRNLGITAEGRFDERSWKALYEQLLVDGKDQLATDEKQYGHRFDASPFVMPRDVWDAFGPWSQVPVNNSPDPDGKFINAVTGDTHAFNRYKSGGVEVVKALDAISYHSGAGETMSNAKAGVYT